MPAEVEEAWEDSSGNGGPAGSWPGADPFLIFRPRGQVAQLVEQRTENPRVGGSIPSLATCSKLLPNNILAKLLAAHDGSRFYFKCALSVHGSYVRNAIHGLGGRSPPTGLRGRIPHISNGGALHATTGCFSKHGALQSRLWANSISRKRGPHKELGNCARRLLKPIPMGYMEPAEDQAVAASKLYYLHWRSLDRRGDSPV